MKKFSETSKVLLVGDNPFHSISHLAQERTRLRDKSTVLPERAADLIHVAVENGANGFMFSVSETTLSILASLKERREIAGLNLYGIVPYAYDYVKLATQVGGISGLAKKVGVRVVTSNNLRANVTGAIGFLKMDLSAIVKTYVAYEVSRIRSAAGRDAEISCILLHEIVTDLALALNMEWLFKSYMEFVEKLRTACGFNTCNFAYLINKLEEWGVDPGEVVVAAPFNRAGFQMSPSREKCEQVLKSLAKPSLVAISVLAAGYLKPKEALEYIGTLPNVKGLALGVSKEAQAEETFKMAKNLIEPKAGFTG